MSRLGLSLCLIILAGCSVAWAAEGADHPLPARGQPATVERTTTPWHDPTNHIRPYKGVRADSSGGRPAALLWVLTTAQGQPLAIRELDSREVDIYFTLRLEAELEQITQRHRLTRLPTEKLKLAAQVDLARLRRLAQQVDGELATLEAGQDERGVNKLFNSLAIACDQQLFDDESLLQRVLSTQLQKTPVPDSQ